MSENVYNMDETRVMLSKLGSVKVLVVANDMRDYHGARVKRKMVTAVECISADGSGFIVNGRTLSPDRQITAGQTTTSASVSGASAVVYINETPTSLTATADRGSSTSFTGVSRYVDSGMGGDAASASASSDVNSESATGGSGEPSTGGRSRTSLYKWTYSGSSCFSALLSCCSNREFAI